jgi:hypothetical protein
MEYGKSCSLISTLEVKHCLKFKQNPPTHLFGKGLWGLKRTSSKRGSFIIGDGTGTCFWEDVWLGDSPLKNQYTILYNIVRTKNVLVVDVLNQTPLNISFNRLLVGDKWNDWVHLVSRIMIVHLTDEPDSFNWHLTPTGSFSVKSMYVDIMSGHTVFLKKYLWKIKVPLKIIIFLWFLYKKAVLMKDNLAKRGWTGCTKCVFVGPRKQLTTYLYHVPLHD